MLAYLAIPGHARRLALVLLILATLNGLDLWTTHTALSMGAHEANYVSAALLSLGGFALLGGAKCLGLAIVAAIAIAVTQNARPRIAIGMVSVFAILYAATIASNLHVIGALT